MRRTYRYKVKMSPSSGRRAEEVLRRCCELYNAALEERREAWKRAGESVSAFNQMQQLTEVRRIRPEYGALSRMMLEDVLKRVAWAFDGFYRRVKSGQAPGYPRFKSWRRYDSMTFRQSGWKLDGRYLTLMGIGRLKLFLSRPIEGKVKTVTLRRDRCGDWFVAFSCEGVAEHLLPDTGKAVGVDVGLASFASTSDGEHVANPRRYEEAERQLARSQRRRSKMKRGGSNYRKHSRRIAKQLRKVRRQRRDFHFKTARSLVERYDLIAVEDLNIRGLARGMLAKQVRDAAWSQFLSILSSKAEEAGRQVVAVDPRGTSQVCSGCGCEPEKRKTLSVRTHQCEDCGLVLDRDVNAARNILTRGRADPAASRPASKAAA